MCCSLANSLTAIRNATRLRKQYVDLRLSKSVRLIVDTLKRSGFVWGYEIIDCNLSNVIRVSLKYSPAGDSAIRSIDCVSKPGNRVYVSARNIPTVLQGLGIAVLSTNRGILSGPESRAAQVGGEYVCVVY